MPPRFPSGPPETTPERPPTTQTLYEQYWKYVFRLLPSFGIRGRQQAWDVAQDVWLTVHRRVGSYDPAIHETPRAWLTGIARRCAANNRRARRRSQLFSEDAEAELAALAAPGLSPEEAALLRTLEQAIPDDDQRQALLLRICYGLTVAEVAAAQGLSEPQMERRLAMARKHLTEDTEGKDGEDGQKLGAFLGFGSLEALGEALRPKNPIPDELGEELWKQIQQQIQQQDTGGSGRNDEPSPGPSSSFPPAAVHATAPAAQAAAALTFTKGTLGLLLAGAFVMGNVTGAGAALAWQASRGERYQRDTTLQPSCGSALPAGGVVSGSGLPGSVPSSSSAMVASSAPPPSPRSASGVTSSAPSSSASVADANRLLLQMRRAAAAGDFARVVTLADEHARRFGALQSAERDTQRIKALRRLGRAAEAEQHARRTAATSPEHKSAMVRALGHALP